MEPPGVYRGRANEAACAIRHAIFTDRCVRTESSGVGQHRANPGRGQTLIHSEPMTRKGQTRLTSYKFGV